MKYKFLLLTDSDTEPIRILLSTDNPVAAEAIADSFKSNDRTAISQLAKQTTISEQAHGNCRQVTVIAAPEESHLKAGDVFESAMAASLALGKRYPAVSMALKKAADLNEATAKVAGVEFQYTDTIKA